MIDPDVSLRFDSQALERPCSECKKENALPWTAICQTCQLAELQRGQDILLTNKVVERAERDSVYAARLKMALGL